jgi:hypothetical protein
MSKMMRNMQITIEIKSVYGRELIYPGCEVSHIFAQLANKKTLDEVDLKLIKDLGYDIKIKAPSWEK